MGGDPIPTPFSWSVKQLMETNHKSLIKAKLKPIIKSENHPSIEARVVIPREKLGKDAYRCKPNEGLFLTSEGAVIVKIL